MTERMSEILTRTCGYCGLPFTPEHSKHIAHAEACLCVDALRERVTFLEGYRQESEDIVKELRAEVERWVEWARSSRCIYCGTVLANPLDESQEAADKIKREHVASCEKHPLRVEKARAEKAERERDEAVRTASKLLNIELCDGCLLGEAGKHLHLSDEDNEQLGDSLLTRALAAEARAEKAERELAQAKMELREEVAENDKLAAALREIRDNTTLAAHPHARAIAARALAENGGEK